MKYDSLFDVGCEQPHYKHMLDMETEPFGVEKKEKSISTRFNVTVKLVRT